MDPICVSLGYFLISIRQPWIAVSAGSLIFVIVLAFNFLGAGLRDQLDPERRRRQETP